FFFEKIRVGYLKPTEKSYPGRQMLADVGKAFVYCCLGENILINQQTPIESIGVHYKVASAAS
ncbi:MAG: hypothetical protein V1789_09270, partial [PVC group bacterium]